MAATILTKQQMTSVVAGIIRAGKTYGVKRKENAFAYGELLDAADLVLDYDVTLSSPRTLFQPPREELFAFSIDGSCSPCFESTPFTVIGVHPYDLKALNQMDRIWAEGNADPHYLARRKSASIIALEPTRASKWSFWAAMDAVRVETGFDLLLSDIGGRFVVEIGTEGGRELLAKHAPEGKAASPADLEAREKIRRKLASLCLPARAIKAKPAGIPELIRANIDHPIWEKQAGKCYGCGSCNLVCPTCYCFDVQDRLGLDLRHGTRSRSWDGCLFEAFAHVGSGENFREHRFERFRHRLLRKTVYVPAKIGELACVGCGRCSQACLPDITDPVSIINAIQKGT